MSGGSVRALINTVKAKVEIEANAAVPKLVEPSLSGQY